MFTNDETFVITWLGFFKVFDKLLTNLKTEVQGIPSKVEKCKKEKQ